LHGSAPATGGGEPIVGSPGASLRGLDGPIARERGRHPRIEVLARGAGPSSAARPNAIWFTFDGRLKPLS